MKKLFWLLLIFCTFAACDVSNTEKNSTQSPTLVSNNIVSSSGGDHTAGADSAGMDSISFDGQQHIECPTCIDPPGDEGGGTTTCTVPDDYTLSATLNNTTLSTTSSDIPTWRLAPFWGSIIGEVENELENFEQNEVSQLESSPYHQFFEIDRRVIAETTVMPNGQLGFSLKLFDLFGRLYFQRTTIYTSNAIVTVSADAIEVEGVYNIAQDNFVITGSEFENLDADVDISGVGPLGAKVICFLTLGFYCPLPNPDGDVEETIRDLIADEIDQVNRNSPNMFLRSLIDYPEIGNILPLLDQAIMELLQDDVSATLNVALPSCGDIDRDGLIGLDVSTN